MALARPNYSTMVCGENSENYDWIVYRLRNLSLNATLSGWYPCNYILLELPLLLRAAMRSFMLQSVGDQKSSPLMRASQMMDQVRSCAAMDPKDKVYALLAMFETQGVQLPAPDYRKTVSQVYWEATTSICKHENSLNLLQLVSGFESRLPDVPSWVPNFNEPPTPRNTLRWHKATKTATAEIFFSDNDRKLYSSAAIVDAIRLISPHTTWQPESSSTSCLQDNLFMNLEEGFEQTVQAFRDWVWLPMTKGTNTNSRYKDLYIAIKNTLSNGSKSFSVEPLDVFNFNQWLNLIMCTDCDWLQLRNQIGGFENPLTEVDKYLEVAKENPELRERFFDSPALKHLTEIEEWKILCAIKVNPGAAIVHHYVWAYSRGCKFFVTDSGYMGTALCSIQAGDLISLIPGVETPMVLRPVGSGHGNAKVYQVIAPAYVEGMMEGEIWDKWESKLEKIVLI